MTDTLTRLPTVAAPTVGKKPRTEGFVPSSSSGAPSFNETARTILGADPTGDDIATLNAAIQSGGHEYQLATAALVAAKRTATDPLASDAAANAARLEIADIAPRIERIEAAYEAVNDRLESLILRQKEAADAAKRGAMVERARVAVDALVNDYPKLGDKMAALVAEVVASQGECHRAGIRDESPHVLLVTKFPGLGEPVSRLAGLLKIPRIEGGGADSHHYPRNAGSVHR